MSQQAQQTFDFERTEVNISRDVFLKMSSIKHVTKWVINISGIALDDLAERLNRQLKTNYRPNDISRWLSDNPNDPRSLPADVLIPLQKILGCNYILEWEAYQIDHEIRPAQTAQEKRIRELEARVEEAEKEKSLMMKIVKEMRGV